MSINSDKLKDWTEICKNTAQILAFIFAGIWAYYTFLKTEKPLLENRNKLVSELHWYKPKEGRCEADFDVTFENIGKQPFDVSWVQVRAWRTSVESNSKKVSFIDSDYLERSTPFFDEKLKPEDLLGHYAPGIQAQTSFSWFLPEKKDAAAAFRIDIFDKADKSLGYTRQWSYVFCSEIPNKEKSTEVSTTKKTE